VTPILVVQEVQKSNVNSNEAELTSTVLQLTTKETIGYLPTGNSTAMSSATFSTNENFQANSSQVQETSTAMSSNLKKKLTTITTTVKTC
jgi:hypothetical protein